MRPSLACVASILLLAGCDGSTDRVTSSGAASASNSTLAPQGLSTMPLPDGRGEQIADRAGPVGDIAPTSCADARGEVEAARLVQACLRISPATRPPCNVANSCAMIEGEIARGCALLGDDASDNPECRPLPDSGDAAANVVRRYYDAIDARDFATAWSQWGPNGRAGQTYAAFEAGFAKTRSSIARVGAPASVEGGAGSIQAEVPVTVTATLEDGRRQRFTGTYVVRRVNDVDGSEPWQRQWHLQTATLNPIPVR